MRFGSLILFDIINELMNLGSLSVGKIKLVFRHAFNEGNE